ncbi:hypothetical protein [Pedobacter nyackensis]|uniref:Uncharacterized protein n=1 Tax=Pedobacter nyackensis TaxID=475255 RepID=A0A1W1ZZY1_9SPHI|nr:hypothetical protein [Pedobacter nyackensis]SMC54005.1 hypothetical protein SAMN04488101_101206 [Pedobacter nyackensis]
MKQQETILPFELYLNAYLANDYPHSGAALDMESVIVFEQPIETELAENKMENLMQALQLAISKDSLGSLVDHALQQSDLTTEEIKSVTGLTESVLDSVKNDLTFTNSIPVKSLVKLLKMLDLPLDKVKLAIEQTFEKLSTESKMFLSIPSGMQPSFRKGARRSAYPGEVTNLRSDESYLYQNREALDKYTKRLTELYNQF